MSLAYFVTGECGEQPFRRPQYCRERLSIVIEGESMTQQSFLDQTDVNAIVERFQRTGVLPVAEKPAVYDDVTGLQVDLTTAIERSRDQILQAGEFAQHWKMKDPPKVDVSSVPSSELPLGELSA